jgi:type IV secretion system protein VirD4
VSFELILGRRGVASRTMGFAGKVSGETGDLITYSGDGHLMTVAPTGTGKTSGPVICNALTHKGQLIVVDIKGEIYAATVKARRKMGQQIHVLDLRENPLPGSLNPLDLATHCGGECGVLARSFAAEMIDEGSGGRNDEKFWSEWTETMLAGAISWLLADCPPEDRKLSAVFDLYNDDDVVLKIAKLLDAKKVRDRAAWAAMVGFAQLPSENTRGGVLASVQAPLRLFDSDEVRRLTDTSSMNVGDFIAGAPMSLYIIVPPARLLAYRPLLRLWLSSLILAMTERKSPPRIRTLMLCDEIGNIGRMDSFLTATTLLRSWGLTIWSYWQNIGQLQIYGTQANTIVDNAGVIQVFGARNLRSAQDIANIIGGVSAEQILNLPKDEQMLLIEGKLRRAKQVRYYQEEIFRSKAGVPARV